MVVTKNGRRIEKHSMTSPELQSRELVESTNKLLTKTLTLFQQCQTLSTKHTNLNAQKSFKKFFPKIRAVKIKNNNNTLYSKGHYKSLACAYNVRPLRKSMRDKVKREQIMRTSA